MMNADARLSALDRLIAHREITDALYRVARGVDRLDRRLILSGYHDDALEHHGSVDGSVHDFIAWLETTHRATTVCCTHDVANVLVEFVDANKARSESYALVHQVTKADDEMRQRLSHGRYIDLFERRAGEWKIAERTLVLDWVLLGTSPGHHASAVASWGGQAVRSEADPSYRLLGRDFGLCPSGGGSL